MHVYVKIMMLRRLMQGSYRSTLRLAYAQCFSKRILHGKGQRLLVPSLSRSALPRSIRQFTVTCHASHGTNRIDDEEIELELPSHCTGCGIELQQKNPNQPGFFQVPQKLLERLRQLDSGLLDEDDDDIEFDEEGVEYEEGADNENDEESFSKFDDLVLGWLAEDEGRKDADIQRFAFDAEESSELDVLCARCYSLRHYGKVKSEEAESSLPGFDFGRVVGRRLQLQKFRRAIVLVVVDLSDFDGSLPRTAIRSLLSPDQRMLNVADQLPKGFRMVVAANKSDLLPHQATKKRIEAWVRRRIAQGGLPRPSAVHIVSSLKQQGVKRLLSDLQAATGTRGDVWVVGAQNAGKSSLINSMRQAVGLTEREVTASPLPGTTLGVVQVPGLLPKGCQMLDTPGVPHEYQLARYLSADEMKMVLPKRQLKPRTYRIAPGQSISLGGMVRLDVLQCPGATMYLTVWVSDEVRCHMGKTEGAEERYAKHAGGLLSPPVGDEDRMATFPVLVPTEVKITGDNWKGSSADVAIAGLGWVAVGVGGEAGLRAWAPPDVSITTRDALIPDFAKDLERPGFGEALSVVGKTAPNKQEGGKGKKGGGGGGKKKK